MRVYLDHNATTPLRPEARAAMMAAMDAANPSSVHAEGRAARGIVERARAQVAAAVGCKPAEVVFTSGATEAASVLARLPGPVVVDEAAHDALWAHRRAGEGAGTLALGLASGETGIVAALPEPLAGRRLLIDVSQAVGRVPFAFGWSGADLAIVSAHKLGGPRGAGALIVREGLDVPPLVQGGGQEMGRRAGTENVAAIAGFGAAAEAAVRDLACGAWDRVAQLRDYLEAAVASVAPETIFVGNDGPRLPNTTLMVTRGWLGETQVMAMDLAGIAVSAGSACSSGKVGASRALRALGFDDTEARCALRASLGLQTTEDEVARLVGAWCAARARRASRAA